MKKVLFIFLFASCTPKIDSGVVVSKHHEEARRILYMTNVGGILIPQHIHDDEDWVLMVRKGNLEVRFETTKPDYDRINIGDSIKLNWE